MMCDGLIYSTNPGNWTFLNGTHRAEGLTWLSIWQHLLRLTFADHHLVPFLTDLVDHQTPAGLWWLCGHSAVRKLPVSGSWTCTLGRVVPGLRVSPTLPTLRRRNKRGTGEAVLRGFFPMYGAAKTYQELIELSQAFERFMNDSAISFSDLTNEQGQIRTVVLQNRLALDFLLSSHRGVCSLIGSECCTHITDSKADVIKHINDIGNIYHEVERIGNFSLFSGFSDWFSAWPDWHKIIFYIVMVLALLISVCCCLQCIPNLMQLASVCLGKLTLSFSRKPQPTYMEMALRPIWQPKQGNTAT
ncbi:endogenous retrovirus group PABLB member 1 Env polyprotein-like [Rhineura floridana]|uniref:endogenous retrovirus group PABLB member 1 Env polyprotein-like n=1 Tax=Rhineura floridana TaxID=261503 RepID=UPI002AC84675|nr:endogenous retrovirus group PABLB member 1 Env polyprotein-like [Rhineura floridana]